MTDKTEAQPEALRLADEQVAALLAEVERLTAALKKANDQTEHFEREWYLRGDCIERLTAELVKEAARTANEKLRADQMTQRLDMANRLGNDARAELAQLRQAGATAPQGWKLVPVKATRSMMAAAVISAEGSAVYKSIEARFLEAEERKYGESYEAMLAASPTPPAMHTLPIDLNGTDGINAIIHYKRGWRAAEQAHGIKEGDSNGKST